MQTKVQKFILSWAFNYLISISYIPSPVCRTNIKNYLKQIVAQVLANLNEKRKCLFIHCSQRIM